MNYPDVKEKDWFYTAVKKATTLGVLKGYPDGDFRPGNYLTRAEYAAAEVALMENLHKVVNDVKKSVCIISGSGGKGSGFLADPETVITNVHVALVGLDEKGEYIDGLTIEFMDGTRYSGKQVFVPYGDGSRDCAIIKIPSTRLTPLTMAKAYPGEPVYTVGCPIGLIATATKGIVSHDRRHTETMGETVRWVQTDAAINPGNSGGALVNIYGQVVGMPTWKYFYTDEQSERPLEGMGFALHTDEIIKTWNDSGEEKLNIPQITFELSLKSIIKEGM